MRDPIVIVGSGASAVHFAQTALELGRHVVMLDIGHIGAAPVQPGASLNQLKAELDDPVRYFLGDDYRAMVLPANSEEYYGLPPSKSYVFRQTPGMEVVSDGFAPLHSHAGGGLAQAWTAGCYPFNDGELAAFPFGWDEMAPAYTEVAQRIGVSGLDDDLSRFYPLHGGLQPPIPLDAHSQDLLSRYEKKRSGLHGGPRVFMGRARLASLSQPHEGREGCWRCGRCLWGCPTQSLYTPSITLEHLKRREAFEYVAGVRITHFSFDEANRVTHAAGMAANGEAIVREVGTLVLAAGALGTSEIVLESLLRAGTRAELHGLMDNRQVLMPFINLARVGAQFDDRAYQYNQIAAGAPGETPFDYVHGLVTTLTTALVHPVMQTLPLGVRASMGLFRNMHAALGLVNINFPDTRREDNRIALEVGPDGRSRRMLIHYRPDAAEPARLRPAIKRFRALLLRLGCLAPPHMTRARPMGASVHYTGTLPMLTDGGDLTTDRAGRCRPFDNLIIADGATFPSLPAKNLTFTLMANATRIARENFGG